MQIKKYPITTQGYERLQEELRQLKGVSRPQILQAIAEARAHGDLSENAEYHAAKEKQGFIEARIKYLEECLSRAEVIDIHSLSGDRVLFGATVVIMDEDSEDRKTFQIVGEEEANVTEGLLSIHSPLGQAIIGKQKGESFEFTTPNGLHYYYIEDVRFPS